MLPTTVVAELVPAAVVVEDVDDELVPVVVAVVAAGADVPDDAAEPETTESAMTI